MNRDEVIWNFLNPAHCKYMTEPALHYVVCPGPAAQMPLSLAPAHQHRMAYWEWNATGDPHHPHVIVCVHGLSRQGRDFDVLARALSLRARVVCPDVAGRGYSDWLADPQAYQVPQYAADMLALLAHVHQRAPITTLDWVGTSMGGLIGMVLCGQPGLSLPDHADVRGVAGSHWPTGVPPVRRFIINDVGPALQLSALQRIGQYVGQPCHYESVQAGADALHALSATFGPHTPEQWLSLSTPMLRPVPSGGFRLHYDPAIAVAFRSITAEDTVRNEASLWDLYDRIQAQTLLLRGAESDLLSSASAHEMTQRGPKPYCLEWAGIGHAPTLVDGQQVQAVERFLFDGVV